MRATNGTTTRLKAAPAAGVAFVLAVQAGLAAHAETRNYDFEMRDGERVGYEVPVTVEHPGELVFEIEWDAPRVLAFRIDGGLGSGVRERRSGPSPQRLEIPVAPAPMSFERYVLTIAALPAAGGGSGHLTVTLPDPPGVVRAREEAALPPPPPPPKPAWWMVPREVPPEAHAELAVVVDRVEQLRARVVIPASWTVGPDSCRWQADTLVHLAAAREAALRGELPALPTARFARRLAQAAQDIEALRTTTDPILCGPAPEDPSTRRAWRRLREQRLQPLERRLDELLVLLRGEYVPQIAAADWPWRLVSCMTACQRHFEERVASGPEAANAELAEAQWDTIRAAAEAFGALAALVRDPEVELASSDAP